MRFIHRLIRNLVLPNNAGPNDPSIIIGPDIRAALTAYYAAGGPNGQVGVVIAAEIFQENATTYVYQALVNPTIGKSFVAFGGIESIGLSMSEAYRITIGTNAFGLPPSSIDVWGGFNIDGVSTGRGPRMAVSGSVGVSSGNGLTTPAAESTLFSAFTNGTNSMVWKDKRTYCVGCTASVFNNLAGAGTVYAWSHYQINIRSIHSGAVLGATQDSSIQSGHLDDDKYFQFYIKNSTGADITSGLEISIVKGASSIGATMTIDTATITVTDVDSSTGVFGVIAGVMS